MRRAARLEWTDRPRLHGGTRATRRLAMTELLVYVLVALGAVTVTVALGHEPLSTAPALDLATGTAIALSASMGIALAFATIVATRLLVRRSAWARALHDALRPAVHGFDDVSIALLAIAGSTAEELLFRGLLTQTIGVVASSVLFALAHQLRGRARWSWVVWAFVMGLLFAGLFVVTGSLIGPIVAHVLINGANLRFLRDAHAADAA